MANVYWYIDIGETSLPSPPAAALVGAPKPSSRTLQTFTVGPVELPANRSFSVKEMVDKIQNAFNAAHDNNNKPQYYIRTRVRPAPTIGALLGLQDPTIAPSITNARSKKELILDYQIYNEEDVKFDVLLYSGDYGFNSSLAKGPSQLPPSARVTVTNTRDIRTFEVPYCSISATISDRPPTPPDTDFIPYVGTNNKLLILLNSRSGNRLEKPILLHDDDFEFIRTEYQTQHSIDIEDEDGLEQTNLLLEYRNDDPTRKYDIFRVEEEPTSYQSFRGNRLTLVEEPIAPDKFSTAVSFIDDIVPNRKYWYCARARDIHNNISNPTAVFEVEMVDDRGRMYLINKPFVFKSKSPNVTKNGRRYLAVQPRLAQTIYDPEVSPGQMGVNLPPDNNILGSGAMRGTDGDLIWNKKFKIRVTSKKTGRKIDLNLTFKNDGVVTP